MEYIWIACPNCAKNRGFEITRIHEIIKMNKGKLVQNELLAIFGTRTLDESYDYHCLDCHHQWQEVRIPAMPYSQIQMLKVSIGGFFDGYSELIVDLNKRTISFGRRRSRFSHFTYSLSEKECRRIVELSQKFQVLEWRHEYMNHRIRDGTQWSVVIYGDDIKVEKYGSNLFPKNFPPYFNGLIKIYYKKKWTWWTCSLIGIVTLIYFVIR